MFWGGFASPAPLTLICNCTASPTATSELLRTAVTLGESANTWPTSQNAIRAQIKTKKRGRYIDNSINYQPSTINLSGLPVVIDMARGPAFIKFDPFFFIFHRLQ